MPMLTLTQLQLLDVVALRESLPEKNLFAGQVGTIVEELAPEVYEVEFSDDDGQTYAMLPLKSEQLLKLYYHSPHQEETMTTHINQHGSGDNVTGDKVMGNKQFTNNLQGANIANFANEVKDNATQQATNFTQNSGINTADLVEIINAMHQNLAAFPAEAQEELQGELQDLEDELNQTEGQRKPDKIFRRIKAIAKTAVAAFLTIAVPLAGMTDFLNNITDLTAKVEPAQIHVIQEIIQQALPSSN
jgi:hypothetical protein